jgi:hypothetical protein
LAYDGPFKHKIIYAVSKEGCNLNKRKSSQEELARQEKKLVNFATSWHVFVIYSLNAIVVNFSGLSHIYYWALNHLPILKIYSIVGQNKVV